MNLLFIDRQNYFTCKTNCNKKTESIVHRPTHVYMIFLYDIILKYCVNKKKTSCKLLPLDRSSQPPASCSQPCPAVARLGTPAEARAGLSRLGVASNCLAWLGMASVWLWAVRRVWWPAGCGCSCPGHGHGRSGGGRVVMLGRGQSWLGLRTFKRRRLQRLGTPQTCTKMEKNAVEAKKEKKRRQGGHTRFLSSAES